MDLIYSNSEKEDMGVLQSYALDVDLGTDNTFSLEMGTDIVTLEMGAMIYSEGTEYGGLIDSVKIVTRKNTATYGGRTWRGLLSSKIIVPTVGAAYKTVSGELNQIIGEMVSYCGLDDLFEGSSESTGLIISDYSFARYIDLYTGIRALVNSVGCKLNLAWNKATGKITVKALEIEDYSDGHEVNSDQIDFEIERKDKNPNHVIGLGSGELEERLVINRYIDENGEISDTPFYTGADEWTIVYDYANAESADELIAGACEALLEEYTPATIKVNVTDIELDIDDTVTARDIPTDVSVKARVINKIVQISNGLITISYKVE